MKKAEYKFDKYWYLGFLSLLSLPTLVDLIQGEPYLWLNFLWLLWLLNFIPNKTRENHMSVRNAYMGKGVILITIVVGLFLLSFAYQHEIHAGYSVDIQFKHKENTLTGTLLLPDTDKPYPVVIFVHGDGPQDRFANGDYTVLINNFLENGIGVFSWDKQGVGDSTGNWLHQSMEMRADEALAAFETLQERSDVKTNSIGFIGFSQSGWVLPKIASKTDHVAYIVIVGGAVNWMEQKKYFEGNQLKILGEIPADSTNEERKVFISLNKESDVQEDMAKVEIPLLAIFGEDDLNVDTGNSFNIYSKILKKSGNQKYEIIMFPNATHSLLKSDTYNFISAWTFWAQARYFFEGRKAYSPGYLESLVKWVKVFDEPF